MAEAQQTETDQSMNAFKGHALVAEKIGEGAKAAVHAAETMVKEADKGLLKVGEKVKAMEGPTATFLHKELKEVDKGLAKVGEKVKEVEHLVVEKGKETLNEASQKVEAVAAGMARKMDAPGKTNMAAAAEEEAAKGDAASAQQQEEH